jgi:hypothetical protein
MSITVNQSMSALGQKRTYALQQAMSALHPIATRESRHLPKVMSALPPKADMCGAQADVSFGPIADIRVCRRTSVARVGPGVLDDLFVVTR